MSFRPFVLFTFVCLVAGQKTNVTKLKAELKATKDRHELCCYWAYNGHCESNPKYMKVNCQRSCGTLGCLVENDPMACPTQLNTKCGGEFSVFDAFLNNAEESNALWSVLDNVQAALNNPPPIPHVDIPAENEVLKQKRFAHRTKRQESQIQKDFPDGEVSFMPDTEPYVSTIGSLLYQTSATTDMSFCTAAVVNVGSADKPKPVVLTASHCVVAAKPKCCTLKTCDCDPSKDTFCDKLKEEECSLANQKFQFRANYRRNKGEGQALTGVDESDGALNLARIHIHKGVCYNLCSDATKSLDGSVDFALIELGEDELVDEYLELAKEVPTWAANVGYSMQNCMGSWDADHLPGQADADSPQNCWGNYKFQQPIGVGGGLLPNEYYNDGYYIVHTNDPSGNGDSGASWLTAEGKVIGVTSFRDGTGKMWSAKILSDEFNELRQQVVEGHDPTQPELGSGDEDSEVSCCAWAKRGECDTFPFWMRVNCQESCGTPQCTVQKALTCTVRVKEDC